ncbi:MAG: VTT domain-containing protein, partial [Lentisphaeria bacterium]
SLSAGLLGYGLVRIWRERVSGWLAKPEEIAKFQDIFERWGGAAVIVSRIAPILPEVMTVLAGLAKMRFPYFFAALVLGTVPVTALFSWWGSALGNTAPATAHTIAILAPLIIWPFMLLLLRSKKRSK